MTQTLDITILGLSITSSWGNGHATTYRALGRALAERGHRIEFLERDLEWYAENRDLPTSPHWTTRIYHSLDELRETYAERIRTSDLVIVGSYVPDGVEIGRWVNRQAAGLTAFYDIDTPVTLAKLDRGDYEYISPELVPAYDLYLSFTGGPTLRRLEAGFGSPVARALYCSVDPRQYYPDSAELRYELGYLGTYSDDRQPTLERLLLEPARRLPERRFVVAGPQYPDTVRWPDNVERIIHLPPREHRAFYNAQRFTVNVTRRDMIRAGYSPSVRLFEAAACGTPIVSDWWPGLDAFFVPDHEILVGRSTEAVLQWMTGLDDKRRAQIAERARRRVLAEHTATRRAEQLEMYFEEAYKRRHGNPGRDSRTRSGAAAVSAVSHKS